MRQNHLKNDKLFFKKNVMVEPLICRWYAQPRLLTPQTASLSITNYYLKILESFLEFPETHENAMQWDSMRNGPFVLYKQWRLSELAGFYHEIITNTAPLINLSKDMQELRKLLTTTTKGKSLEKIYPLIPESLSGAVELVYNLNDEKDFRLIERILFNRFNLKSYQSFGFSKIDSDYRKYNLSTPRLEDDNTMILDIAFNNVVIDTLFESRKMGVRANELKVLLDRLHLNVNNREFIERFFDIETDINDRQEPLFEKEDICVKYFGHASLLFITGDCSILIDPVISYDYDEKTPRYTYSDLPGNIDYILITHGHLDHLNIETLLQLRYMTKSIIVPKSSGGFLQDPCLKLLLRSIGFRNVFELDEFDSVNVGETSITGIPFLGEHGDLAIRAKISFLIKNKNSRVLICADSNNISPKLYTEVQKIYGNIKYLFISMESVGAPLSWIYGYFYSDRPSKIQDKRKLTASNAEKIIQLAKTVNSSHVYIYAMGNESWIQHLLQISTEAERLLRMEYENLLYLGEKHGIVINRLKNIDKLSLYDDCT